MTAKLISSSVKEMNYSSNLLNILFILSLAVFIYSYFQKNNLPPKEQILSSLSQEPKQVPVSMEPLTLEREGLTTKIFPLYTYELWGLVVSDYDSENWLDFSHKEDPFNIKDFCAVWGENAISGIYHNIKYDHGEFSCSYQPKDQKDFGSFQKFSSAQISNSHLIPGSDRVYREMKKATVGDQIYFSGYLVRYTLGEHGFRGTSTVRTDTGNGACEVVYVTDFEILREGNLFTKLIYEVSKYTSILIFIALVVNFVKPRRYDLGSLGEEKPLGY